MAVSCVDRLVKGLAKVPEMLAKGKLGFLPHGSGGAKEVRAVFRRAEEEDKKQ